MKKAVWVVLVVIGLFVVLLFALPMVSPMASRPMYDYGNGGMMGPWMMGGFGILGPIMARSFAL